MANSCWWTRSDGQWWSLTIRKTQPAVISKGDHLLITAISVRNSSPSRYLAWQAALREVWLCADRWKHCLFCFSHCCFQSFLFQTTVIESIISRRRGEKQKIVFAWSFAVSFVFVITELSFDSVRQCFCVGCKLAISLSYYHSNGHCKAPVRRSWPVYVEKRMLLCYTLKDHFLYFWRIVQTNTYTT